jgi:DNA-binding CsgD family transcriptional regulator
MLSAVEGQFPHPAVPWLAHELCGISDPTSDPVAFLDAMLQLLNELFPSDAIGWNAVDTLAGTVVVRGTPAEVYNGPDAANALAAVADDHPMVVSYLGDTQGDHKPRRLADLIGRHELRRTRTYAELLNPLGIEQQLTVLTSRSFPAAGRCWTFARQKRPWSDGEVALAISLQPVLVTLDAYAEPYARPVTRSLTPRGEEEEGPGSDGHAATPSNRPVVRERLTQREVEVLTLVARGFTAVACGHLLRISPATVRKHLEHAYDKLGVHDRLLAVERARREGLL